MLMMLRVNKAKISGAKNNQTFEDAKIQKRGVVQ